MHFGLSCHFQSKEGAKVVLYVIAKKPKPWRPLAVPVSARSHAMARAYVSKYVRKIIIKCARIKGVHAHIKIMHVRVRSRDRAHV